jgi:hypothetical protein
MSRHTAVAIIAAVIGLLGGPGSVAAEAAGAPLTLAPASMNFGNVNFNSAELRSFTLQNVTRGTDVGITGISTTLGVYSVWSTTCGSVLRAGQSCTIVIRFGPPNLTLRYDADLVVRNNIAPSNPALAFMTGTSVRQPCPSVIAPCL